MCSVAFGVRPAARFETCKPNMFGASHAAILCLVLCTEAKVVLSMGETVRLASDYTESEEVYVVHSHVPCTVWKSASKPCCSNRLQAGWRMVEEHSGGSASIQLRRTVHLTSRSFPMVQG